MDREALDSVIEADDETNPDSPSSEPRGAPAEPGVAALSGGPPPGGDAEGTDPMMKEAGRRTHFSKPEHGEQDEITHQTIPGPDGDISIHIYTPADWDAFPVIVYLHGDGGVLAKLDVYDPSARSLATATEAVVVSTLCRPAPGSPFSAAHEGTFAAYLWVLNHGPYLKGDRQRVPVLGQHTGGNRAAARERNGTLPWHQVLIFPVTSLDLKTPGFDLNACARPLNRAMMQWLARHELPVRRHRYVPRIDRVNADLRGLPSTTIVSAETDPLRWGGEARVEKNKAAGVRVEYKHYPGVAHEFFGMGAVFDEAREATRFATKHRVSAFDRGQQEAATHPDTPGQPR